MFRIYIYTYIYIYTHTHTVYMCSVAQSCLTLCKPMDCSPPGSSVLEILQARILEQMAISSSRGSSQSRDRTRVSLHLLHWQADSSPLCRLESSHTDTQLNLKIFKCTSFQNKRRVLHGYYLMFIKSRYYVCFVLRFTAHKAPEKVSRKKPQIPSL